MYVFFLNELVVGDYWICNIWEKNIISVEISVEGGGRCVE